MFMILWCLFVSATLLDHGPLQAVYIYFDTATFDEIERDEKVTLETSFGLRHVFNYESAFANVLKVTMEAQLGLIGGTMGLLTGFSILSGVEIIYYLLRCFFGFPLSDYLILRFFVSLKVPRAVVV